MIITVTNDNRYNASQMNFVIEVNQIGYTNGDGRNEFLIY